MKGHLFDFEVGKNSFLLIFKGLILFIGFPNNKYPPNNKNSLTCLLIGEGVSLVPVVPARGGAEVALKIYIYI